MRGMPAASPSAAVLRLFLALWPGPAANAGLLAWRDAWQWPRDVAPVRPERLHVTLHFLGDVAAARLPELRAGLAVPFSAFELRFGRPALWPHGIAVLQPTNAPQRLQDLHACLGEAAQRLGLRTETRPYRPHVTLARAAEGAVPPVRGPQLRWTVRGYALVESRRAAAGQYRLLERYAAR